MAIYEYTCQECHHHFSVRRSMAEADAPIVCPKCGGLHTQRGLSLCAATSQGKSGSSTGGSSCSSCGGGSCSSCGR
ncbi:MAG: zinc ribbon domain-containing protein [Chloroflexi bacterium]|nr:zinc ribbon domain-containing protein [Anaerolineae bacterium]RLC87600.1 MAG: zinc ribbon domain-containing protein [Chloroflexota bacterium]